MRKSLVLAIAALLCCSVAAFAGVPDPSHSSCELSAPSTACHYKFRADGGLDILTVDVTLRDVFDVPVVSCSTSCTLTANAGTLAGPNECNGDSRTGFTNAGGAVQFTFDRLNGRGSLDVVVVAHCSGDITICTSTIEFTSPNLDGSANGVTDVFDLGVFAGGLPPNYDVYADYTCDGGVDVFDLGVFAGGLNVDCTTP